MTKKVYLLRFKANLDLGLIPDVDDDHTVRDVAEALREAADELEDYADWTVQEFDATELQVDFPEDALPSVMDDRVRDAVHRKFGIKYLDIDDIGWTTRDYRTVDFPDWALCALVNGDPLEDKEDREAYDAWEKRMLAEGFDLLSPDVSDDPDDHNEFCANPAFGLACGTTKVRFFKKEEAS